MKTTSFVNSKVINKNAEKGASLTLDADSFEHIISTLTNLYSSPASAVLREYVSNALDSHILAKQTRPVEVTLPVAGAPNLTVQDFGVGMSLEAINTIYRQYGSSTKGKDNGQIGGFGLGGKSALALGDYFEAVSIHDGVSISFHIEKMEGDIPRLYIDKVEDTKEANGFTVRIPYKQHQFITSEYARQAFIGLPVGSLLINGKTIEDSVHNPKFFTPLNASDGTPVAWYTTEYRGSYSSNVNAIVGGILYSVERDIKNERYTKALARISKISVNTHLNVPIGTVKFTPSREKFIYNDKTIDTLVTLLDATYELLVSKAKSDINACTNRWNVIKLYNYWQNRLDLVKVTWRGKEIETHIRLVDRAYTLTAPIGKRTSSMDEKGRGYYSIESDWQKEGQIAVLSDGENLYEDAVAVRRKLRVLKEAFGYETIEVLSKNDYENVWLNSAPSFGYKHKKTSELLEAAKAYTREQRIKNGPAVSKGPRPTNFAYNVVTFEKGSIYTVNKVLTSDSRLKNKKVVFLSEQGDHRFFPSFYFYNETSVDFHADPSGFWTIARKLYKNHLVLLVSNRHSMEKFTTAFPDAKAASIGVREEAAKKFVPILDTSWTRIQYSVHYQLRPQAVSLSAVYREISKNYGVFDEDLDALSKYLVEEPPVKPADYDVMARLVQHEDDTAKLRETVSSWQDSISRLMTKYALLHAAAGVTPRKDNLDILAGLFTLIQNRNK